MSVRADYVPKCVSISQFFYLSYFRINLGDNEFMEILFAIHIDQCKDCTENVHFIFVYMN